MNTRHLRIGLFAVLLLSFGVSLIVSASMLPERVATHFNGAGQPDGWMTRSTHLWCMAAFGGLFSLFLIGVCWGTQFLPAGLVNIPHREYWLATERRAESVSYMIWHAVWFGCLALGFVIGLHWLIVFSNRRQPVGLPLVWVLGILIPFLAGVAAWVFCLYRRFRAPETASQSSSSP